jgi:hypothetical protein
MSYYVLDNIPEPNYCPQYWSHVRSFLSWGNCVRTAWRQPLVVITTVVAFRINDFSKEGTFITEFPTKHTTHQGTILLKVNPSSQSPYQTPRVILTKSLLRHGDGWIDDSLPIVYWPKSRCPKSKNSPMTHPPTNLPSKKQNPILKIPMPATTTVTMLRQSPLDQVSASTPEVKRRLAKHSLNSAWNKSLESHESPSEDPKTYIPSPCVSLTWLIIDFVCD